MQAFLTDNVEFIKPALQPAFIEEQNHNWSTQVIDLYALDY